ncbi:iron ABC transporter permease [Oricola sp.]|uniref:ABC transporter permease n=1 Tax=Oricola sp. TaxID=1979950 RepID=UPI0025E6EFA0|nr:iron ABC transporter permease [Oricola sp.]MCI5077941.1 iron ABC transporter permease [Oricola sp.]
MTDAVLAVGRVGSIRGTRMIRTTLFWAAVLVLAWAIVAFLYAPLASVLGKAFLAEGRVTTETIARLADSRNVRQALWNTVWMTAATLITVNLVGLFQVVVLEFVNVRGSGFLKIAFATPLVFSSVTAITGYNFVYGDHGAVTELLTWIFPEMERRWFRGWPAVLIAHSFLMTHYHFLFLRAAVRRVDYSTVEAARSLGASPFTALVRVVFPVVLPTVFAISLLVLLSALTSFAAPAIVGGREFRMLNQMILGLNSIRRADMAAMLALMLGAVSLIVFLALRWIESRGRYTGGVKTPVPMQRLDIRNRFANTAVHAVAWALFVIYATPVVLTILFSFAPSASIAMDVLPSRLTLSNYVTVLTESQTVEPLINSAVMSLLAVGVVLALSLFASHLIARYRHVSLAVLEFSLFIPWVLPSSLVAIGLIIAYDASAPILFGNVLLGSYAILPIAYGILIVPMMVRLIGASMTGLDPTLDEAARALGAGPLERFVRVTLPLLAPVLILVSALAFNDLINEYTVSAFLYNPNNRPLGVAIASMAASSNPEQLAQGLVYATLVMGFSFIIILVADRLGLGRAPLSAV